ncbi:hypothetical protein Afil01_49690 [Actinorhabdospora filicis]|uniref:Helix-turn-helix domain-containing protein n=1 Tax=Actinorhabdospora filicis TaxID=1785913 RepID=A0A9W6SQS8_9ACTN|nr:helix-turn-helix transcriptional regulator [Actinorhabdospora filicis]GLZ80162.1 hypothetical protein Afil01_49690 [Actinorhabdospora filicis]
MPPLTTTRRDESPQAVIAEFAARLRDLRERAGNPPYRDMARLAGRSHTALVQAARGRALPSEAITVAFAAACGSPGGEWRAVHRQYRHRLAAAGGTAPAAPAPVPPAPHCPLPEDVTDAAGLRRAMRLLKLGSGLSYSEISRRSRRHTDGTRYANGALPRQTIADLAGGAERVPHLDVLRVFLRTLGHTPEQVAAWTTAYVRARARPPATRPAAPGSPVVFEHRAAAAADRPGAPVPLVTRGAAVLVVMLWLILRALGHL